MKKVGKEDTEKDLEKKILKKRMEGKKKWKKKDKAIKHPFLKREIVKLQ